MCVRERILALRLLEKQKKNPDIAKRIGIEIQMKEKMNDQNDLTERSEQDGDVRKI